MNLDFLNKEQKLESTFDEGYFVNLNLSEGSFLSETSQVSIDNISSVENGKAVNNKKIGNYIATLDSETTGELVNLLNIYRGETPLEDMLFNYDSSEKLYKVLDEACNGESTNTTATTEDYHFVQKTLLDELLTSETDVPELDSNTLLSAKEYITEIGKQNNVSPSDIILDERYDNTLKIMLNKVYDGTAPNVSEKKSENFRTYVDRVASKNGTESKDVLNNQINYLR